jgi:ParB/RepB/Spo0J family partition protein
MKEEIKKIIQKGYFKCTLSKSDVGVKRCIEFQDEKFCSCELGEAIKREREAVEKRFDFVGKRKPRTPKNAKLIEINPRSIVFISTDKPRSLPEKIIVYDTPYGYFSYDKRVVDSKKEKIQVALVPIRSYEKSQRFLKEINAMEYREIPIREILPCHFQKRRNIFKDLDSLVDDIKRNGVIEPIIVRPMKLGNQKWELICGERRLEAGKKAGIKLIPARIVEADNIQARLMHLSENLQRKDLTPTERTEAIADFLDTVLRADPEVGKEYKGFGKDYVERVKRILSTLDNVRRSKERGSKVDSKVEKLSNKFVGQVEKAFSQLSRPVNWQSFFLHDLPLITEIDPDVQELAIESKLSGSQIKALDKVKKEAPQIYDEIKEKIKESPKEVSAEHLRAVVEKELAKKEFSKHPLTNLEPEQFALVKRELGEKWKGLGSEQSETLLRSSGDKESFKASLSSIKEGIEEQEEYGVYEYEPEKTRQRKPTFDPVEDVRKKLDEIEGEIKNALSLFRKDEDDLEGFMNSLGKLVLTATRIKKSIEEEAYESLAKISSNGHGEKVREYPWAKKILEAREKGPDPRVKHIKDAYTRQYIQNFKENPTEPDGKIGSLSKQLLAKTEEEEIMESLQFYLSHEKKEIPQKDRRIYEKPRTFGKFFSCFAHIREHMRTLKSEPPEVGELTRWYVDEVWEGNPPEDNALIRECWKELLPKAKKKSENPIEFLKEVYSWWKNVSETEIEQEKRWITRGDTTRSLKGFHRKFDEILSTKQGSTKWSFKNSDYTLPEEWKKE